MNRSLPAALGAVSVLGIASASYAAAASHKNYIDAVDTYKPQQSFNYTVSTKQFAGFFTPGDDACNVTLMIAEAGGEEGRIKPVRVSFGIPAAGRSEFAVANGQALAMACTVDGDKLKVAALSPTVM